MHFEIWNKAICEKPHNFHCSAKQIDKQDIIYDQPVMVSEIHFIASDEPMSQNHRP